MQVFDISFGEFAVGIADYIIDRAEMIVVSIMSSTLIASVVMPIVFVSNI